MFSIKSMCCVNIKCWQMLMSIDFFRFSVLLYSWFHVYAQWLSHYFVLCLLQFAKSWLSDAESLKVGNMIIYGWLHKVIRQKCEHVCSMTIHIHVNAYVVLCATFSKHRIEIRPFQSVLLTTVYVLFALELWCQYQIWPIEQTDLSRLSHLDACIDTLAC